jgi:uncharacterized protein (DUF58 family)
MLPPDVGRQLRRLQLRARRAVANLLGGEYHSVFKGPGLAFAVDASASLAVGSRRQPKREVVAELAALLAFAALHNNDRVGLLHCTDRVEHVVPPRKGARHAQRLLRDILFFQPTGRGTGLRTTLDALNRIQRKRAIVFLFSDFLDVGYERALRLAGRRHDLVAIRVRDPLEEDLPNVGLLELADAETGEQVLVDTGSAAVRAAFAESRRRRDDDLRRRFRGAGVDAIEISTNGGHLDALIGFFRRREQRLKHQ